MTYLDAEFSEYNGKPVEIYRFTNNALKWLYTSGEHAINFQSEIYTPEIIKRSNIEQSNDINRTSIEINVPRNLELASLFLSSPFNGVVSVTIFRTHVSDVDEEFITYWKGRITGGYLSGSEVTFKCEPISSGLNRIGLRAHYQLLCRHVLYDGNCKALKESYKVNGIVSNINKNVIVIPEAANKPDGYYVGGFVFSLHGSRLVVKHEGENITLSSPLVQMMLGDNVQLYAGCNHSMSHCKDKFNNLDNYGGFPFIPLKNPFSGDAIV